MIDIDEAEDDRPDGEAADHLLHEFFARERSNVSESTAAMYGRIEASLRWFLDEANLAPHLGTHLAMLLAVEREFRSTDAFFRVCGVGELLCCLPGFVSDAWLPTPQRERRAQIALVGRLVTYLGRHPAVDLSLYRCAWFDARDAVRLARELA